MLDVSAVGGAREASLQRIPSRIGLLATWIPRIAVALAFIGIGSSKFRDPMWVRLFGQIGFGQWFRYLTGAMQVGGGIFVLIPRLSLIGLAMIACTLAGAAIAWLTVLHAPANAPIPGILLAIVTAIAWSEYQRTRA